MRRYRYALRALFFFSRVCRRRRQNLKRLQRLQFLRNRFLIRRRRHPCMTPAADRTCANPGLRVLREEKRFTAFHRPLCRVKLSRKIFRPDFRSAGGSEFRTTWVKCGNDAEDNASNDQVAPPIKGGIPDRIPTLRPTLNAIYEGTVREGFEPSALQGVANRFILVRGTREVVVMVSGRAYTARHSFLGSNQLPRPTDSVSARLTMETIPSISTQKFHGVNIPCSRRVQASSRRQQCAAPVLRERSA